MLSRTLSETMSNTGRMFSEFERLNTLDEIKELVKDRTLAIVIGKGKEFDDEELKKIRGVMGHEVSEEDVMSLIHTWLNDMIKDTKTDIATNGSDYNKTKDDGSVEKSTMYEMASNLECDVIGVTHPNNVDSCNKFVGNNTKWLIESDGNGWGGHDGNPLNPIAATKTTIDFMEVAKKVYVIVIGGGYTTAKELEVYNKLNVEIRMLDLEVDSPAELNGKILNIKMDKLSDV